jgi:hypothetical protein
MDKFNKGYFKKFIEGSTFYIKEAHGKLEHSIKITRNNEYKLEIEVYYESQKPMDKRMLDRIVESLDVTLGIGDFKLKQVYFKNCQGFLKIHNPRYEYTCKGEILERISRFEEFNKDNAVYIIEHIENLPSDVLFDKKFKTTVKEIVTSEFNCPENDSVFATTPENNFLLTEKDEQIFGNKFLDLLIDGIEIYLIKSNNKQKIYTNGIILYKDYIEKEKRDKIRESISYYLGRPIVLLEDVIYDKNDEPINFNAYSPYNTINGRIFKEITEEPESYISITNKVRILNNCATIINSKEFSKKVDNLYTIYDQFNLMHVLWSYWHSLYSAVHTICGELGATIEALTNLYIEKNLLKFDNRIIDKKKFQKIKKESFNKAIDSLDEDEEIKNILKNKISNDLNKHGIKNTLNLLFEHLKIQMHPEYLKSWEARNHSAHGNVIKDYDMEKILNDSENLKKMFRDLLEGIIIKSKKHKL